VVLFLGRLVPVKGADLLLRACAGLDGVELVLAGEGPERPGLERLARRLDTPARFVGPKLGPERDAWLAAADLLVLPSRVLPDGRGDSAPVVLLEALAAGLPLVATRVGGNAELLEHGQTGLLVPPDQPGALRRAITRLRDDPDLRHRLGQAGRRLAADHTWDRVGARLLGILASL
jgi:glycosyltransferase involved in cell wall biosynthesis